MTHCEEKENSQLTKDLPQNVTGDGKDAENHQNGDVDNTHCHDWDEHGGVPVDRGYAWFITLSVFVIQTMNFGFNRTVSVLLKDITVEFESSLTVASLCFTLLTLTGGLTSLVVSNVLMARFSVRTLSLCGSLIGAVSVAALSVSPSIGLFLALFVVKGFAFGVLLVCPNSLMGYYFKAKRGLATALCNSGFCVSYIVYPILAESLNSAFGLRGCLLIMAAIELNLVACSMLLVPPSVFKKHYLARKQNEALKKGEVLPDVYDQNEEKASDGKYDAVSAPPAEESVEEKAKLISQSAVQIPTRKDEALPVALSCSPKSVTSLSPPASPTQPSYLTHGGSRPGRRNSGGAERQLSLYASQQSLAIHSVPYFPPEVRDPDDDTDDTGDGSQKIRKNWKYYLDKVFDTSLFKIYCFRMYLVFSPLASFGAYLLIYMPFIAQMAGLTQSEGALLMTISGCMDLLTRMVLSLFADKKWFSKTKVTAFSMVVLGVVCHSSVIIDSYNMFLLFALIVGAFGGIRQTLVSIIILDYVGVENFAKGFGFLATVCTLTLSLNHPIVGAMIDATNSFVIPLHYVGMVIFVSVLVIMLEPCCRRLDEKRRKREAAETAEAGKVVPAQDKSPECV
ncbi:hypothetical protein EGW08_007716 [Elysia chlorotica]|uniref:Major facilitator superfamily (MFS) profile domain-containing protein n=1 Tax=Elysia chlorotica TaxID=188477 RepID=A0A3S1HR82_ELYCH|nr:hypothetical protein EGW08_007716 [Elysia chlorotica]